MGGDFFHGDFCKLGCCDCHCFQKILVPVWIIVDYMQLESISILKYIQIIFCEDGPLPGMLDLLDEGAHINTMISIQLRVFFLHQDRAGQAELVEYLEWFGPVREALRADGGKMVLKFATDLHEKGALIWHFDIFFAS